MSKLKTKLGLCAILLLAGAAADIYLSTLLHLTLKQEFTDAGQLNTINCLSSLMSDKQHQLLYLTILLLLLAVGAALFLLGSNRDDFASDVNHVTEKISTPVPVGQGQHGTAKWLPKSEYPSVFYAVEIRPNTEPYQSLIEHGYDDLPEELGGRNSDETEPPETAAPSH